MVAVFERILIIRLTALGDVVLATPALRALRAANPNARIDWLVHKAYAPVLEANPHLSSLITYDQAGEHAGAAGLVRLRNQLRRQRYDLVVDLQAKPKTAALRRALGAKGVAVIRKRTRAELLRAVVGMERPLVRYHATELYLNALAALNVPPQGPALECVPTDAGRSEAAKLLGEGQDQRFVALAPGARWATKRWEPARFAEVGNRLADAGHELLLIGGPGDGAELDAVRAGLRRPALDTRALGVAGVVAAIARCKALVAGDSGPVHLADALGVPTVALYGPTAPRRWAPRDPRHRIIHADLVCSPCSNHGSRRCPIGTHRCMKDISAEHVAAAALDVLAAPPAPRLREARAP